MRMPRRRSRPAPIPMGHLVKLLRPSSGRSGQLVGRDLGRVASALRLRKTRASVTATRRWRARERSTEKFRLKSPTTVGKRLESAYTSKLFRLYHAVAESVNGGNH